ncbi:hypothetical protein ACVSQ4_27685 [Klebsiella pneumoniae]|jgi:hypothetical protein
MTRDELQRLADQISVAAGLDANAVSLRQLSTRSVLVRVRAAEFTGSLDEVLAWALDAAQAESS